MWTGHHGGAGTGRSGAVELLGFEGWVVTCTTLIGGVGYSPRGGELRGDGRGDLEGTGGLRLWNLKDSNTFVRATARGYQIMSAIGSP